MKHDENCLFCKIVEGNIPSNKVYEDDKIMAFKDVNPMMPVHVLIVPKDHYRNLSDDVPPELLGHLFGKVGEIAKLVGVATSGYRVKVNNGDDAKQVVQHLHVHLLGGAPMTDVSPLEK